MVQQWRRLSLESHHHHYDDVIQIRIHYNRCRAVSLWRTKLQMQRVRSIELEYRAAKFTQRNQLSWIMRKFKHGVLESRREKRENQVVEMKWQKVREWLDSS